MALDHDNTTNNNTNDLELRLRRYSAVRDDSYYHQLLVTRDGHLNPRQRLSRRQVEFLVKIGADVTLFDGKRGEFGVPYIANASLTSSNSNIVPVTLSHARQLNEQLLRENRITSTSLAASSSEQQKQAPQQSATVALNSRLVLQEQGNQATCSDDKSLVVEARKVMLACQVESATKEFYENFAKPSLLATAAIHVPTCGQRERESYIAARNRTFCAIRAYSDACEAVHVLHEMEHNLGVSVREARNQKRAPNSLESMVQNMETDGFVASSLRASGYGELTTWALAMSELPDVLRHKKARDKYIRLPKIYKDIGRCYDAVKVWKQEIAPFLLNCALIERRKLLALFRAWDKCIQL